MQNILSHLKDTLNQYPDFKYSASLTLWQTDFLRFYRSQTNYNISKESTSLSVNIYKLKKAYSFSIDNPTTEKIDAAIKTALNVIDTLPEDPHFVDVESDPRVATPRTICNNILAIPLEHKTKILSRIAHSVEAHNFELFGTFICNFSSTTLINSNQLLKTGSYSPIYLEIKAVHRESQVTVMETFGGDDFAAFDLDDFEDRLLQKIAYTKNPITDVDAGQYDVILAPRCFAEFVQYLSYGMSAYALDQRSSYFEGKIDSKVFPEIISITDDPMDHELIRRDYNSDGHIYETLKLIDKGFFRSFMCNSYYHHKTGLPKNGNSALCLRIDHGNEALDEMIGQIKKGLYISSLHYMNFINPKETSLTGLTRDGTFLIEDGKITKVVNNLRFTERISRIMENTLVLENRAYTIPFSDNYDRFDIQTVKAPHALVKGFNITSSTRTI